MFVALVGNWGKGLKKPACGLRIFLGMTYFFYYFALKSENFPIN
jgi:hypothetical protein